MQTDGWIDGQTDITNVMQYSLLLEMLYMFQVEKLPETCRALTIIKNTV